MKNKINILAASLLLGVALPAIADGQRHYDSYKGLVMAGYQGWFNAPGDGADRGWHHYESNRGFQPGSCTIDLWPDVTEYETTYPTDFRYDDGSTARVFSSYDESTVDTHFRWMKEYGLDGVFMQRFVAEIRNPSGMHHFTKVLDSAMKAANKYERAIAIMYDLSGMYPGEEQVLIDDIRDLRDRYSLMNHEANPSYLYHNGRPLVTVWGVGFDDNRRYGFDEAELAIDSLKQMGFSVMIGVPTHWREMKIDTQKDSRLHKLIKKCDIVMPWFVGRYNAETFGPKYADIVVKDIKWTKKNKVDYAPLSFPGFSWRNMPGHANTAQTPRDRGNFLWQQLSHSIASGAEMIYIAMFDEIDEGTAVFKCAKRVPVGKSTFVPVDEEIESDHYLWLIGQAARMLRGEIPLTTTQPARD